MISKRSPRALLGLWFTVALVLGAMAGPALTTAAVPGVYLTVVPSPPEATQGSLVGFTITVDNRGNSTSSQSSVDATIPNATTYAGVYPSSTSCSTGTAGHVICSLGGIAGHSSVTFALAFRTDAATPSPVSTTVTGQTTGTPGDRGGNSHGDNFIGSGLSFSIALVPGSNGDFSGAFVTGDLTVQDNQTVGSSNLQATKVKAPGIGIGVSVKDGAVPDLGNCTLGPSVCDLLFGQNSAIFVGGNTTFPTAFPVTVTLSKFEIPGGINETNIAIYHTWTDATGFHEETISARCTYDGLGNPTNPQCLTATKSSTGITVVVWLFHNGNFRTF